MKHIFTVDFEEWFHGLEIPMDHWGSFESRIEGPTSLLLDLLDRAGSRATFFVLGRLAESRPDLVRELESRGHQVGTHGYSHTFVYKLGREGFAHDLDRSLAILRPLVSQQVTLHRAPYFSIRRDSLWALETLADRGIRVDSSIFPVHNYRYGIPGTPDTPYRTVSGAGEILEWPITVDHLGPLELPFSGGFYFRLLPYTLIREGFRRRERRGKPVMFYLHPWEIDPEHPRIPVPGRIALTHYTGLSGCAPKLERLLGEFQFETLGESASGMEDIPIFEIPLK